MALKPRLIRTSKITLPKREKQAELYINSTTRFHGNELHYGSYRRSKFRSF